MKNTRAQSITAVFVIAMMLTSCATPNGSGPISQEDPCQPNTAQSSFSPQTSFLQQTLMNPLAKMGGSLLATAAANYSEKYTGKLSTLLTKMVTPKKKRKKKKSARQAENQGFPTDIQGGQPGFESPIDPNTGLPIQDSNSFPGQDDFGQPQGQIDPNTGLPIQGPNGFPGQEDFGQPQGQIDPNTGFPVEPDFGFVDEEQAQEEFPQEELPIFEDQGRFQPAVVENIGEFESNIQGDVQTRAVPGNVPQFRVPSNPCDQQQQVQDNPPAEQQNQPYGNDPAYQAEGYDPYGQQQGGDPYGQTDPYAQQGYPQDPYGQQQTQQDPYAQQGYPEDPYGQQPPSQEPYAQQGYPQDPDTPTGYSGEEGSVGKPIGLDVVMLKKTIRNGAAVMLPINDGDILKDGRGNVKAGDKFRVMFRPHTDGYVYVVAIDGSGWAQGIFPPPTSPLANPVKAGQEYTLPEGNNWFSLDQFKGIETIFFVASQEKRQDLEEVLQSITGQERLATATPQRVTKVAMVPYGVGGARPSAQGFNLSSGSGQTIIPTSYFSKTAGEDLRLTRWFRHE